MIKQTVIAIACMMSCSGWIRAGESGSGLKNQHQLQSQTRINPGDIIQQSHILVKFKNHKDLKSVDTFLRSVGSERIDSSVASLTGYFRVAVPDGMNLDMFLEKMKRHPKILNAQSDFICRKLDEPNDPYYQYQWNFQMLNVPTAWELTAGGTNDVSIAILDTGVAYENHGDFAQAPDLAGTHFSHPYDFVNSDTHANDDEGHGTHVAGTIAQTTNNALGVAGIAYGCTIMPLKILDSDGVGSSYSLAEGIAWAVQHGASVINMSLGFAVGVNPGRIVEDEIRAAFNNGVICVAAAGNDADDPGYSGGLEYPGAYPECVCVGSIRFDRQRAYYSNYGSGIDCVAPGGDLRIDQNRDGYGDGILQQTLRSGNPAAFDLYFYQGTSMATPHVAAAAALFKSRKGGDSTAFMDVIAQTSIDLGAHGLDQEYGYGLIDLLKIIKKGKGWGANS